MKTIVITGASGGIGASIALMASKNGYNVCLHYYNDFEKTKILFDQIIAQGGTASIFQADISKEYEVQKMFGDIEETFGQIYALINNAGVLYKCCRLEALTEERIKRVFEINVLGYMLCAKYAIKLMSIKHNHAGGKIINISSAASRLGSANEYIDYACSKGAIDTLTKGLSIEVADEGILVNAIRPGFIETGIHDSTRLERLKDKIPLKRSGQPDEVASAVMWLLSEGADYTTGSFIDMAGGL